MSKLLNKVAVVTGASGAIGLTTAKLFLEQGAKVVLVDINEEALSTVTKDLNNPNASYVVADVTKATDVQNYVKHTVETFGKIDVFFNNAGIEGAVKPITEYPEDMFDRVININVKGVWLGIKYVLPEMNDGGSIINTSSMSGLIAIPNFSGYITSKHAIVGITRAIAIEAAPRKIRVNSIHPTMVESPLARKLEEGIAPGQLEIKKAFTSTIPLGRYATLDEIAQLVSFLAGDKSRFITGTTQVIDGGSSAQ